MLGGYKINYLVAIACSMLINGFAVFYLDQHQNSNNWILGLSESNPQQIKQLLQNITINDSALSNGLVLNKKISKHHLPKRNHILAKKAAVEIRRQPRLQQVPPKLLYPAAAIKNNQEGRVKIAATISASGKPEFVRVIGSSGFTLLDESAVNWFKKLKFVPAAKNKINSATKIVQVISFQIKNNS